MLIKCFSEAITFIGKESLEKKEGVKECVKTQGGEIENEGKALKYMTQSEIDEQRSSLRIMTQRHLALF